MSQPEGYVEEIEEVPIVQIAASMVRYILDEGSMTPKYERIFQSVLDDGGYLSSSVMAATAALVHDALGHMTPEQRQEWWMRIQPDGPI